LTGLSSPSVTEQYNLGPLPKIEQRRADQVSDILDRHGRARRMQVAKHSRDYRRIEVTAYTGVELHDRRTNGTDLLRVVFRENACFELDEAGRVPRMAIVVHMPIIMQVRMQVIMRMVMLVLAAASTDGAH
jgi:hypothetical protein